MALLGALLLFFHTDVGHGPFKTFFLSLIFVSSAKSHLYYVMLCYIGRVSTTNWWPHRLFGACGPRPIVKVAMGCHTEAVSVHIEKQNNFFVVGRL